MNTYMRTVCIFILYSVLFAQANILDRTEYKLGRIQGQMNARLSDLESVVFGSSYVPFSVDGDVYPVDLATSPVFLSRVSGLSRLTRSQDPLRIFNVESSGGIWWRNDEGESNIAVSPVNSNIMIVVTSQDRSNLGISLGASISYTNDGGVTWGQADTILSKCQGPTSPHSLRDFDTVANPSVTFDASGNAYVVYSAFNVPSNTQQGTSSHQDEAILFIKSSDGGQSWTEPTVIAGDDGSEHWLIHPTIFFNPYVPNEVYATWADWQYFVGNGNNSVIKFTRSLNAGTTWDVPVDAVVVDSSIDNFAPDEAHILVDPLGSHKLYLLVKNSQVFITGHIAAAEGFAYQSTDDGATWNLAGGVTGFTANVARDPDYPEFYVRTFPLAFDSAINTNDGRLYAVVQADYFAPPGLGGVCVFTSIDGGVTWSSPIPVNPDTLSAQAFNPSIRSLPDNRVGVLYYDFRNHTNPASPALETDVWLAIFNEDLSVKLEEIRITPVSFDLRQAMRATLSFIGIPGGSIHYFLGDYCKLDTFVNGFVASFPVTNPPDGVGPSPLPTSDFAYELRNRQDIIFASIIV